MRQRVVSRLGRGRRRGMNHDEAGAVRLSRRVCFDKWGYGGGMRTSSVNCCGGVWIWIWRCQKKTKKTNKGGDEMSRRAPAWGESSPRFLSSPASTRKPTGFGGGGGGAYAA